MGSFKFFPSAIGAMDCTISKDQKAVNAIEQRENYRGDKHSHFINTLLVCNYSGVIIYIDTGFAGRSTDQNDFKSSKLYQDRHTMFSPGQYLLCDGGFTCDEILIKPTNSVGETTVDPLIGSLKTAQCHERVVIENVNAFVKRFAAMKFISRHSVPIQSQIVLCCCLLSNRQLKVRGLRSKNSIQ